MPQKERKVGPQGTLDLACVHSENPLGVQPPNGRRRDSPVRLHAYLEKHAEVGPIHLGTGPDPLGVSVPKMSIQTENPMVGRPCVPPFLLFLEFLVGGETNARTAIGSDSAG